MISGEKIAIHVLMRSCFQRLFVESVLQVHIISVFATLALLKGNDRELTYIHPIRNSLKNQNHVLKYSVKS